MAIARNADIVSGKFTVMGICKENVKSLYLTKHHAMNSICGVEVELHTFLTSTLDGCEWSALRHGRFIPGTHWTGDWVGPRAGLDTDENYI
jgi:hypothetical protein